MATTITSEKLREELITRLRAERGEATAAEPKTKTPEPDMFNAVEETSTEDKQEYAEIIGEAHPSGVKYYFTVHSAEDWDEDVRGLIPEISESHVFDHDYALAILMGIEYNKVVFAYGAPGTGKTTTPEQICARINRPFMFIGGMGGTEPSDYVGSPWVEDGNMVWKDAAASLAVRKGVYLLYDEPFKASAQTNMCFQSLMDDRRTLKLYGHPDPVEGNLKAHKHFRMCLADNVRGFGDDMDKYAAEIQDQSTLNRCAYKVHVDYVEPKVEKEILARKFPNSTEVLRNRVVSLANLIREGWKKGDLSAPYSVRDTQELVEAALIHRDVGRAFTQTYFGAIKDESEVRALRDMWSTAFGSSAKLAA